MSLTLREIPETEIGPFFDLIGEIECGDDYDSAIPIHVAWVEETIRRRYGSGVRFYGMYDGGNAPIAVVGMRLDRYLDHPNPKAELTDVGVFAQYRDKGYGSNLLSLIEGLARQAGVRCLYMCTYADDYRVIAFYGKNGYAPVATIPDMNGPDAKGDVYMRKILG